MNLTIKKRNSEALEIEQIEKTAQDFKLHKKLIELLFSRGIKDKASIYAFLNPDIKNLYDPFLLKGMEQAVQRLNAAIENNERVVIYGDYDADGICATAILSLYLSSRGLNVYSHIPDRVTDGYGLSVDAVEKIIDGCCPDLIVTCDCGISGFAEVEYALDLGVDMIVTDHHEVSDKIPSCTVINAKQPDCEYPFKNLCGAGVALKLVQALGGVEAAAEYFDLAALATVADLVPLNDENRLIVQLGLESISEKRNIGLKALIENQKIAYPITSGDIAYKLAPRINAAGRMGDASRAFQMLTDKDVKRVSEIAAELEDDNTKRKAACDELYDEAIRDLQHEDLVNNRAIILSHPSWEKGITGIVAARLAGDFKRPSFVLVNSGESYKGTCRGIQGVNMYELLASAADILVEFGGHSQAAGFSILPENIEQFKVRVNEFLQKYPDELFLPSIEYDLEIAADEIDLELVKALECMEPTGNSNSRPLFLCPVHKLVVSPCKTNANHTVVELENGLQLMAFNFYNQNQFLAGTKQKQLVMELQLNTFNGRQSAKGVLKGVGISELVFSADAARANFIKMFSLKVNDNEQFEVYEKQDLSRLTEGGIFGTLVVASNKKSFDEFAASFPQNFVLQEFLYSSQKNNFNRVIVAPEFDENLLLNIYKKVIFLDSPPKGLIGFVNKRTSAKVYIPKQETFKELLDGVDTSREVFKKYFDAIRQCVGTKALNFFGFFKALLQRDPSLGIVQFTVCLIVFNELGIFRINKGVDFSITANTGTKTDLSTSKILKEIERLQCK